MAVVATRAVAAPREPAVCRRGRTASVRAGRARRIRSRARGAFRFAVPVIVAVVVFAYVAVYATLTSTSYDRHELTARLRLEKIRNQRLKVELVRLSSPQYVMAGAERAGMIPAAQYDYLRRPETVAIAGGQAD